MATLLSAQMAQRSKKVLGTGHGRGRPLELLSPFGATAPAPASGMMVTGTMSGIIHERQDHSSWFIHPREPDTCAFAEHEDGHTKMAAFKIPGPTATVFMGVLAGGDSRKFQHRSRSIASIAHSQGDRAPGRPRSTWVHDRRPSVPTKSICIARVFYAYTSLGRQSERIRRLLAQDAALARKAGDASEFENTLVSVVQMAYKLTTARAARSQTDIMGGQIIVSTIQSL